MYVHGAPRPPAVAVGYSRAPTAILGEANIIAKLNARLSPPDFDDDEVTPYGPSLSGNPPDLSSFLARRDPMQLFVLGYGENDVDGEPCIPGTLSVQPASIGDPLRRRAHDVDGFAVAMEAVPASTRARTSTTVLRGFRESSTQKGSPGDGLPAYQDDGLDGGAFGTEEGPDAFAKAMCLPVRIGQVFSALPADAVSGLWSPRRAAFAATVSIGLSILAILSAIRQISKGKSGLIELMVVVFYLVASVISWLFIRLARYWGTLLRTFRAQERSHGACPGLRTKLTAITSVLLGVSIVEHSLSEMQIVTHLRNQNPNASTFSEYWKIYTNGNYPMVLDMIGYWPILSPFLFFLNLTATFLWNFNDLFIMLVAVALASRFKCLRLSISKAIGHRVGMKDGPLVTPVLGTAYWRSARCSYNSLTELARLVDKASSMQLFVSFFSNLYFVCMQLLRGFDVPAMSWYHNMYIIFSFSFLVARTSAVSLMAASVHENSRSMLDVLFCVCSEDYNEEVYRFLMQVTTEQVALTGCNMFNVTRGLLLTVAGTILTYEVVLVQMN